MDRIGIVLLILFVGSSSALTISPYAINSTQVSTHSSGNKSTPISESTVSVKGSTANLDLDISLFMGKKEYEEYLEFIKNGGFNFSYDDNTNESRIILFTQIVPSILIYALTFLVGFFGNLLVLVAITRVKKLQSPTNLFLFSLATADLILICACVPIKVSLRLRSTGFERRIMGLSLLLARLLNSSQTSGFSDASCAKSSTTFKT